MRDAKAAMLRTSKHRLLLITHVAVAAVMGCDSPPEYDARAVVPGFGIPKADHWTPRDAWSFAAVREYGEADGPLAFGYIISVAANARGELAVADYQACTVTVIGRPHGQVLRRFGRCGDGPTEFRRIRSIAYVGDSLLVYDQGRADLAILDSLGAEISRIRIALSPESAIWRLEPLDHSRALAAIEIPSRTAGSVAAEGLLPVVGILNLSSGEIDQWLGHEPAIATLGVSSTLRRMPACASDAAEPTVVLFNSWLFEGIGLSLPSLRERFHFVTGVPIAPREREDGSWFPGGMPTGAVWCGKSGVLFRNGLPGQPEPGSPVRPERTFLEFRSYDGDILMRRELSGDEPSMLHGGFGVMHGDTLFMSGMGAGGFPVVGEFHVLKN